MVVEAENFKETHSVERPILGMEFKISAGFASGKALFNEFKEIEKLDALIFGSEMTAVGTISACQENGITVPQQLSLAMFDGTELVKFCRQELLA